MQPIQGVGSLLSPTAISTFGVQNRPTAAGPSFKDMLFSALERAGNLEQQALRAADDLAAGSAKPAEADSAELAADATLRTVAQVRDALLGALNEIKDLRI